MRAARGAIGVFAATITLVSCGARSALTISAGGSPTSSAHDAGDAADGIEGDAGVEAGAPDAPVDEPCTTAPMLVAGQPVSGTTCGAVNPTGSTCSTQATVFYRFELPPESDVPLHLSGNLSWGVLCECPQGPGCCVGPGGGTGPQGLDYALANPDSTPRTGVIAVSRSDDACGSYTLSLGP